MADGIGIPTAEGDAAGSVARERITILLPDRGRRVRWTAAMRDTFFAHLVTHCNVTAAAAAIGLQPSQVHYRRHKHKPFAALWDEAISAGYALLEMRLIGSALAGIGHAGEAAPATLPAPEPVAWDHAIKLYTIHRAQREGRGRKRGAVRTPATPEQTDAAILHKLASLRAGKERALARRAGGAAADAASTPMERGDG